MTLIAAGAALVGLVALAPAQTGGAYRIDGAVIASTCTRAICPAIPNAEIDIFMFAPVTGNRVDEACTLFVY
jgi:hypothetical protein